MQKLTFFLILTIMFNVFSCSTVQNVDYSYQENSSTNGKYFYEMGVSYLSSGNNAMAISYLEKAIQEYKTPEVYNSLALAYQFSGEYLKAENTFKEGLERFPNSPEIWTNYGILLAIQKRYNEALSYLEKAANDLTYSKKEIVYYNIALIYKNMGKENLFLENMNKSIMYNSNYIAPYISLGDYYYEKYLNFKSIIDLKFAKDYYTKALNLTFNDPVIYYKLGKVYINLGQTDIAKFYLEKALKASSENRQLQEEIRTELLSLLKDKNESNSGYKNQNDNINQNNENKEKTEIKDILIK